ncbi:MAG: YtxH domain-containing protein [Armatimonas sp.]
MNEEENGGHDWQALLAGTVIGLALGGALGLLFAPKAGNELRGDLRDKAEESLDNLRETSAELSARVKDLASRTKDNLAASVEAGKDAYSRTRDEMMSQLDNA